MSHYFHVVLCAFAAFAKETIKGLPFDETPMERLKNMKYYHGSRILSMQSTGHTCYCAMKKAIPYVSI